MFNIIHFNSGWSPPDEENGSQMSDSNEKEGLKNPIDLESQMRKSIRMRSIQITLIASLSMSLGFTISLTGTLPYMKKVAISRDQYNYNIQDERPEPFQCFLSQYFSYYQA